MQYIPKALRDSLGRTYEVANTIEISESAILHNFDVLERIHTKEVIPVLKANAYGHGIKEVASILKKRSFPYIAVDGYYEALKVRQVSKQPVLVMGSLGANNINNLRAKNVSFVAYSKQSFEVLCKSRRALNIHLEINTGMNRHGIQLEELEDVLDALKKYPKLHVEGVMTHLSSADEIVQDYSKKQFKIFSEALKKVLQAGLKPTYIHTSNSAGTAKDLPHYITAVRPGIALYGLNTLELSDPFYKQLSELKPALKLTSKIDQIISLKAGESVGYNRTYKTTKTQQIATIPIGYYEGVPRVLSNRLFITAGGKLLETTGTICMNHTMFDCSNTDLKVGDSVTLISDDKSAENSIMNLRNSFEVFEYSLPTGLRSTIRRKLAD